MHNKCGDEFDSELFKWIDVKPGSIGRRIRQARIARKLSTSDIGGPIGVSAKAVQHWEAGDSLPSISSLVQVAMLCSVSAPELITGIAGRLHQDFIEQERKEKVIDFGMYELEQFIIADREIVGARIREARLKKQYSLAEVGARVGKSRQGVQHWEVGNSEPSLDDAVVISNILETSPFWILMGLHVRIDKSAEKQPAASKGSSPPILSFVPFASSPQATQLRMASKLVGRAAPTFSGIESNTARVSISTRVLAGPLGVIFTRTTCSSDVIGIIAGEPNENLDLIPGDTLIVDRAASLKFGYIVLASINGRGAFGILSRDKNDDIRISRTGKSEPIIGAGDISKLPRHINFTDEERAVKSYVIGVVMEVSRRMIQLDGKPRPAKGE